MGLGLSGLSLLHFGVFELDLRTGELRKDGALISLPPQPFRVLALLASQGGQLVTREEIQQQIWGSETFVDFDRGLNFAINKIRTALGDDAETPRYIETLPRRGYRFIAPVQKHASRSSNAPAAVVSIEEGKPGSWTEPSPGGPLPALARRLEPAPPSEGYEAAPRPRRRYTVWAAPVLAAAVLVLAYLLRPRLSSPRVVQLVQLTHLGNVEVDSKVVSDGERLYFVQQKGGHWGLVQSLIRGGQAAPIPTPFPNTVLFDISPDHSELLVGSSVPYKKEGSTLWALPLPSGSPRRLGDAMAGRAVWSPDGLEVYYTRDSEIDVMDRNGINPRKFLSLSGAEPWTPVWSPDGRLIRFTVTDLKSMTDSIWEAKADGTSPHPLFPGPVSARAGWEGRYCCGVWTPDGRYFLFKAWSPEGIISIWAIREKGGFLSKPLPRPVQLYSTSAISFWSLLPDRDSRTLLFAGIEAHGELLRYDAPRGVFVPFLSGAHVRSINFSRDGKWVLWVAPDLQIWRSAPDGSEPSQVTFPPMLASHAVWSPDGGKILFTGGFPGDERAKFYVLPAGGGTPSVLLVEDFLLGEPDWSPDGQSVVFTRLSPPASGWAGKPSLCVLDLKSHEVTDLLNSVGLHHPIWSPDGHYLAAGAPQDRIMLFDFRNRTWSELATGHSPFWSHDGQYVYFHDSLKLPEQPIYRVRIKDHSVETVTTSRALLRTDVTSYELIGLAPDDSPLVSLDRSTTDVYALGVDLP